MPALPQHLPSQWRGTRAEPVRARLWRWARSGLLYVAGFLLLFAAVGWLRAPSLPTQAPDFTLGTLTGETRTLSALRGQTVVVNFWATWCGPCRVEMPTLQAFAEANPDTPVLYVAVDGTPEALTAFAEDQGLPLDAVLVADRTTRAAYGVSTLPTTVVVGPDGAVRAAHAGIVLPPQLWWWTR